MCAYMSVSECGVCGKVWYTCVGVCVGVIVGDQSKVFLSLGKGSPTELLSTPPV